MLGGSQQIPYHSSMLSRPHNLNPVIFVVAVAVAVCCSCLLVLLGDLGGLNNLDGELLTAALGDILGEEEVGWDGDGVEPTVIIT
jgi:hypothetical protein